jgi:hypothetical protein
VFNPSTAIAFTPHNQTIAANANAAAVATGLPTDSRPTKLRRETIAVVGSSSFCVLDVMQPSPSV